MKCPSAAVSTTKLETKRGPIVSMKSSGCIVKSSTAESRFSVRGEHPVGGRFGVCGPVAATSIAELPTVLHGKKRTFLAWN